MASGLWLLCFLYVLSTTEAAYKVMRCELRDARPAARFLCNVFLREGMIDDIRGNLDRHIDETEEELLKHFSYDGVNGFRCAMYKATFGSELCGFAEVFTDNSSPRLATLRNLSVDAKFRRRGLGSILVEHVCNTVSSEWNTDSADPSPKQFTHIFLNVEDDNEAAQKFYAALGFERRADASEEDSNFGGFGSSMWAKRLL